VNQPKEGPEQGIEAIKQTVFEGLQQISHLGVYVQRKDGSIAYCTPGLLRNLGYTADDVRSGCLPPFLAEDPDEGAATSRQLFSRELSAEDVRTTCIRGPDGTLIHLAIAGHIVDYQREPALVLAAMNITHHIAVTERLRRTLEGAIEAMARTVEIRDPYTAGHQQRVSALACAIAEEMGLASEKIQGLQMAASIHDLGKLRVPPDILSKPGALTDHEFGIIETHPEVAYEILKAIEFPWPIAEIILQHHERLDGSGYPAHLTDDEILVEAQILGVADVVDAMASHRPYRPQLGVDAALTEITAKSGVLFAERIVDACLKVFAGDMLWMEE
jgi:PAS domain S-box-containing protein